MKWAAFDPLSAYKNKLTGQYNWGKHMKDGGQASGYFIQERKVASYLNVFVYLET